VILAAFLFADKAPPTSAADASGRTQGYQQIKKPLISRRLVDDQSPALLLNVLAQELPDTLQQVVCLNRLMQIQIGPTFQTTHHARWIGACR
jgi:hypothetical protein